jgi:DNA-binding NarL/FixJ family response regulator
VWVSAGSAIVKAGVESLLRADFALAPTADTADVCVVDADGTDAPVGEQPVVALSSGNVTELLKQGYAAVLEPDASAMELVAAVRAAAAGLITLDRATFNSLLAGGERLPAVASVDARLTPREHEVLRWMAAGLVNKEIAGKLGISDHTAKFHVASVLQKLNAASRAEAVAIGMRAGLILL